MPELMALLFVLAVAFFALYLFNEMKKSNTNKDKDNGTN